MLSNSTMWINIKTSHSDPLYILLLASQKTKPWKRLEKSPDGGGDCL